MSDDILDNIPESDDDDLHDFENVLGELEDD